MKEEEATTTPCETQEEATVTACETLAESSVSPCGTQEEKAAAPSETLSDGAVAPCETLVEEETAPSATMEEGEVASSPATEEAEATETATPQTDIAGGLAVSDDLSVGGGARVNGDALMKKNLTVEGWLDARNVRGKLKETLDELAERINDALELYEGLKGGMSADLKDVLEAMSALQSYIEDSQKYFDKYLRKDRSDRTPYGLSVGGTLTAEEAVMAKSFLSGLFGWRIDQAGNMEVESVKVRSFMEVYELIYNRLNALEGDTSFADSGTIDATATDAATGVLTLTMRKRWEGDFTAFRAGDIIYGYVNNLENSEAKTYGKAWALVTAVDSAANTLTVVHYDDEDVPSGNNLTLREEMIVTRWGNAVAPSEEAHANPDYADFIVKRNGRWVNTRQQSFFVSCEMGNIVELMGVDSPILRPGNYGTVLGQLPEGLLDEDTAKLINPGQPYLYARGAVVQDLIHIGYNGVRVRTPNFRGAWSAEEAASGNGGYRMTEDTVDIVTHDGGTWQCCVGQAGVEAPGDGNADWIRISGSDFAVWEVVPSVNVIYIRNGSYSTDTLGCVVRRNNGASTTEYRTAEALDATGMELVFSMDGVTYKEYWVREGDTLELEDGAGSIELEDGTGMLDMGGNNVPWLEVQDHIWLCLRDKTTKQAAVAVTVPVVKDGQTGGKGADGIDGADGKDGADGTSVAERYRKTLAWEAAPTITEAERAQASPAGWESEMPTVEAHEALWAIRASVKSNGTPVGMWSKPVRLTGEPGSAGASGPIAYPCGVFDPIVTYRGTTEAVPVVQDGKDGQGTPQYYALTAGKTFRGSDTTLQWRTPHEDAANNGGYWRRMDNFALVFADILMARFAKLGSAVFYDEYMMSQQGVDASGAYSEAYENFAGGGFTPNLLMDFRKGRLTARDVEFYGTARQITTKITDDNYKNYLFENHDYSRYAVLDWRKTGGNVDVEVTAKDIVVFLPGFNVSTAFDKVDGGTITLAISNPDEVRRYSGATAVIRNLSASRTRTTTIVGVLEDDDGTVGDQAGMIQCGTGKCFECYLGCKPGCDMEEAVWRAHKTYIIRTTTA